MSAINEAVKESLLVDVNSDKFTSLNATAKAAKSFAMSGPLNLRESLIPLGPLTYSTYVLIKLTKLVVIKSYRVESSFISFAK